MHNALFLWFVAAQTLNPSLSLSRGEYALALTLCVLAGLSFTSTLKSWPPGDRGRGPLRLLPVGKGAGLPLSEMKWARSTGTLWVPCGCFLGFALLRELWRL